MAEYYLFDRYETKNTRHITEGKPKVVCLSIYTVILDR